MCWKSGIVRPIFCRNRMQVESDRNKSWTIDYGCFGWKTWNDLSENSMMLLMRMAQPTVNLYQFIKKYVSEKKRKQRTSKLSQLLDWGRMGGNWVLNGVLTCGALAQALLGQQLQHREAMTSCQEQRFEMEERPLAVLVRNAIKQGAKIYQNGWRLDTKDDLVMAPLGHLFVKKNTTTIN